MTEKVDVDGLLHESTVHALHILVDSGIFRVLHRWLPLDHPKQAYKLNTGLSQEEITLRLKAYFQSHRSEIQEMTAAATVLEASGYWT